MELTERDYEEVGRKALQKFLARERARERREAERKREAERAREGQFRLGNMEADNPGL